MRASASCCASYLSAIASCQAAVSSSSGAISASGMNLPPKRPKCPSWPDETGHFGIFGGRFVPEALIAALDELTEAYAAVRTDPAFTAELDRLLRTYVGRPTPLTDAARLTEHAGGARILLKREDLAHTGSHKLNNALGQALLARVMGKTRVIAETGAGQHGVATATACAYLGLDCVVYMGEEDTVRQALNVARMRMLGATVVPVRTATTEAPSIRIRATLRACRTVSSSPM